MREILRSLVMQKSLRLFLLSVFVGIGAGVSATVFLFSLLFVSGVLKNAPWLVLFLPTAGLLIGWLFTRFGKDVAHGTNLIFTEIHDPKSVLPLKMAPMILIGTLLTHLFGGSAGREGTAVQMSASIADQIGRFFKVSAHERKVLLLAGCGAGFGAAVGAPWAGVIFGMEVVFVGRLQPFAFLECLIASFVAFSVALLLHAPHSIFPTFDIPEISFQTLAFVFLAGIAFGCAARVFVFLTHLVESACHKWVKIEMWRLFVGGLILAIFFEIDGTTRFVGLGIDGIQHALTHTTGFDWPVFKTMATAVTIGSGFKGGEFVPLVFIGSTLGSCLGLLFPVSFQLLSSVGFAAVFAGASNTPIACSLMAAEIFGWRILPFAFIACFTSYFTSGMRGIYKTQKLERKTDAVGWIARRIRARN